MKINFLGDSITRGACASVEANRYSTLVCKELGAEEKNYGVSGTRIAKQIHPNVAAKEDDKDFITRAPTMDKEADFVFVFGGTNDYGHGDAPLGSVSDKTQYSFYGAMKWLAEYLLSVFDKKKLCFILPLHRYNEESPYGEGRKAVIGAPLSAYIQAEIEVLKYYGIEYLDFRNLFPEPKTNTSNALMQDGIHPNDVGHRLLADKIVEYIRGKGEN